MGAQAGINHNRRTTFCRMAQMNEDRLTSLKNPPRAEFTRRVMGHLESHNAVLQKQVNLWYKEQNFVVNKINRRQNHVYKSFLKINYQQKRLERLALERKKQKELMEKMTELTLKEDKKLVKKSDSNKIAIDEQVIPMKCKAEFHTDEGRKKDTDSDSPPNVSITDMAFKKYNRHRSDFKAPVNAPVNIDAQVPESPLEAQASPEISEPAEVHAMVGKPDTRTKVLIVRKQSEEKVRDRDNSFVARADENQDMRKSFLEERSASFYIQTVVMANEDRPTVRDTSKKANAKMKVFDSIDKEDAIHERESHFKQPKYIDVHVNVYVPPLPAISEKGNSEMNLNQKGSVWRSEKNFKGPMEIETKNLKNLKNGKGFSLGELRTRNLYKKPPPPTSYSYSMLEEEKQRQRALHDECLSQRTRPLSENGWDEPSGSVTPSLHNDGISSKMTIAQFNRQKKQDRERDRREVLDGELPLLYERNLQGELIISRGDFRRREFKKPSSTEAKNRVRLLHQSREDMKVGRSKVLNYIDRLSEKERQERLEREQRLRQREMEAAAAMAAEAKTLQAVETDPGVLLRSLIKAFRKGDLQPNENPNSIESLQKCDYIRKYQKQNEGRKYTKRRNRNKVSSWNQNSNSSIY